MRRSTLSSGPVSTALIMLAIFLAMTLIALSFPAKARLMPLIVGVAGSVLALVQVVFEIRTAAKAEPPAEGPGDDTQTAELAMLGWTLAFFFGILAFGFLYAAPILVFVFLYFGKDESVKVAIASAISTWVVLFGFFETWLGIPLFEGLVLEWTLG